MPQTQLNTHLSPQETARRQRWVVVGVTILGILLVATWVYGLPVRLGTLMGGNSRNLFGDIPKGSYIDPETILGTETTSQQFDQILKTVKFGAAATTQPVAASPTVSTPTKLSPTMIELMKKKLK